MTEPTITTEATGTAQAQPETARVTIEALGTDDTPADARDEARTKASQIRETITAASLTVDSVQSVKSILTDKTDSFDYDEQADPAYRAIERLVVVCSPNEVSPLVDAVSDVDGTVPTAEFQITADTRETLRTHALDAAMSQARATAETVAAAEKLEITSVKNVRTPPTDEEDEDPEEVLRKASHYDFQPTAVTVSERVCVTYEAEPR